VLESRKQMNARDLIHKPILGRIQLAAMRSGMRVVNAIPPYMDAPNLPSNFFCSGLQEEIAPIHSAS
jgi:hypothetical protein